MAALTIEERLAVLENEVAKLRSDAAGGRPGVIGRTHADFLIQFVGIHANSRVFDSAMQRIEAERVRQRQEAQEHDGNAVIPESE
jgi:hypothetical protein